MLMTLRRPYAWQQKTSRNADAVASWLSTSVATKDIVVSATTQALPKSHVKEENGEPEVEHTFIGSAGQDRDLSGD